MTPHAAPAPVAGVLLDVDDTLVDTRGAFRAAITAAVTRWMPHLSPADEERAVLRWAEDPSGAFLAFTRGELDMSAQRRIRVADLHATFGGPEVDDEVFAAWDQAYDVSFRAAWRATEDGVRLVAELDRRGVPFGAVTNLFAGYQAGKLEAVGLGRVRVLGSLETVGVGKPDPRIFLAGCAALGLPQGLVAYVGDEPVVDAGGATAAGLVGVWLDRFELAGSGRIAASALPARRITSLDRLEDVVELRPDLGAGGAGR